MLPGNVLVHVFAYDLLEFAAAQFNVVTKHRRRLLRVLLVLLLLFVNLVFSAVPPIVPAGRRDSARSPVDSMRLGGFVISLIS